LLDWFVISVNKIRKLIFFDRKFSHASHNAQLIFQFIEVHNLIPGNQGAFNQCHLKYFFTRMTEKLLLIAGEIV
jgi:hypothetical protein